MTTCYTSIRRCDDNSVYPIPYAYIKADSKERDVHNVYNLGRGLKIFTSTMLCNCVCFQWLWRILRFILGSICFLSGLRRKILLIGPPGSGKSRLGNFILQDPKNDTFKVCIGALAGTTAAKEARRIIHCCCCCCSKRLPHLPARIRNLLCRELVIIDTPPIKAIDEDRAQFQEIYKHDNVADSIFIVIDASKRFTDEEQKSLKQLAEVYNTGFWERSRLVITHSKILGETKQIQQQTFNETLSHPNCPTSLKWLTEMVESRYIFIDTAEMHQPEVFASLMDEIEASRLGHFCLRFRIRMIHLCQAIRGRSFAERPTQDETKENIGHEI